MKIAVVGTGYVGLVSGVCFAETGNHVICVDVNQQKIDTLLRGELPIYEPGLDVLLERNIKHHRIEFTLNLKEAVDKSDIIFLALPTPPGEDGSADLSYILGVAEELGKIITSYKVVVDKSTVPVGTAELVRQKIALNAKCDFDVVSNPEFLREGVAVEDFMKPDRVVVGTQSKRAMDVMEKLYEPYVRQGNPVFFMDEKSAEMTKYAANSYLAMRISFMNEMANLCEKVGANVDMVRRGMGSDNRIGKRFLFSGIGYGGSCFPKDVQALAKTAKDYNYDFKILDSVMHVNQLQKHILSTKIINYFNGNLSGKTIAIWGLAFKPNTDDIREAPSLYIIDDLIAKGAKIVAYDPAANDHMKSIFLNKITFVNEPNEALKEASALAILTEWNEFRTPDFDEMKSLLQEPIIFDGRNVFTPEQMSELGFTYHSIGRIPS
jgi:UDPglucose 6-dehydrogenase